MDHVCKHGNRTIRSGNSARGPWSAAFCPTPKGTPDQCEPVWLNEDGTPKAPSAKAVAMQAANEQLVVLKEINNMLTMMFAWMKLRGGDKTPVTETPSIVPKPGFSDAASHKPWPTTGGPLPAPYIVPTHPPEDDIKIEDIPF